MYPGVFNLTPVKALMLNYRPNAPAIPTAVVL